MTMSTRSTGPSRYQMDRSPTTFHMRAGRLRRNSRSSGGTATMTGFVRAYVMSTHSVVEQPPPLGYLTANSVFMSNFFARNYLICDHWFAPLPADTHPNRAMAYTGVSLIDDTKARLIPYRNLIFDWLTAHGVRWRVYHSGFSFFSLFGIFEQTLGTTSGACGSSPMISRTTLTMSCAR